MNIVVKTATGHIIVRPDTTWEKDNEDLYPPEFVTRLSYVPILFARVCKPGRSVGEKFASRYFDSINYGVLLYPEDLMDGSPEGFASASCLDHSSFLPAPLYQKVVLGGEENFFSLCKNGTEIFSTNAETLSQIESVIAQATEKIYIRIGDLVAIELAPRKPLCSREEGRCHVNGTYCGNFLLDFNVIMG